MIHPRFGTRMIVGLLCSAAAIVNAQEVSSHSTIREPTGFAVYDVLQADSAGTRVIDLTHAFGDRTIYWPTEDGFQLQRGPAGVTERGYYYSANRFSAAEHGGTHLDAPIHFFKDHQTVDQIPMWRLFGEAAVIDVSQQCVDQSDYEVSIADLRRWEESHDRQLVDVILLLRTGYDKHWPDRERYLGTKSMWPEAVKQLHFPGLDPVAAQWLVDQRAIKAVGIDTASIDTGQSRQFGSHVHLCEHNVPIFENVANLDNLPSSGSTVIALPMKIDGGSGAPLRIIGILHAGVAGLTDEEELPPIECPLRKAGIDKTKLKPFEEVEEYVKFLERADRAEWQRPDAVVKALGLNGTETLVDLGSGSGYFTFRFSKALPQGKVIAIDTQPEMVRHVHRKVLTGQWPNVRAQVGQPDNPGLPANADCVFVCDVLLHVRQKLDWLKTVHSEMRPGAKLVLIDFREGDLPEGPPEDRKVPKKDLLQLCREAGFRLERDESDLLPYQEFLVFERTGP